MSRAEKMPITKIQVVDSHTGGEPTRVVVAGGPELGSGSMAERLSLLAERHDTFRSAVVNEPRGSDAVVGALLCARQDPTCAAGVVFFNNVGYLGMCVHGTIGLVATLAHLGRVQVGDHRLETPVGVVTATLHDDGQVTVRNVPSYRTQHAVEVDVPGYGRVRGDVAWGGNWFFLVNDHREELLLSNVERLTQVSWQMRQALTAAGIAGDDGHEIDHVELFGTPSSSAADSRNFVLCPGKAYDRSPCGTGTSAKLACLYADGKLKERQPWRQESIVGSVFTGFVTSEAGQCIPHVRGSAFVNAEATLILQPDDPFQLGIRA